MASETQRSFAGGQVAPSLVARQDTVKVATGAKLIRNGWTTPTGKYQNRPGTRFVFRCKDGGTEDTTLRRFFFNESDAYSIEVGPKYLRLYKLAEPVTVPAVTFTETTYFLGTEDSDVPPVTGAGTIATQRSLRTIAGAGQVAISGTTPSATQHIDLWTTPAGIPGGSGDANWPTTTAGLVLKTIDAPGVDASSGGGLITVTPRLYRVDASGAVVDGPHASVEGIQTLADGNDLPFTPATYTWTWTAIDWTGVFAPGDRLAIGLDFSFGAFMDPGLIYELASAQAALQIGVGTSLNATPTSWSETVLYTPGDVVAVYPFIFEPKRYWFNVGTPSPVPTGFAGLLATTPYGTMEEGDAGSGSFAVGVPTDSQTRLQILTTLAGAPGWDPWTDDPLVVVQDVVSITDFGVPFTLIARAVRLDSANLAVEFGVNFTQYRLDEGGTKPYTHFLQGPVGGWGSSGPAILDTDRIGVEISYTSGIAGPVTLLATVNGPTSYMDTPSVEDLTATPTFYVATADNVGQDPRLDTENAFWGIGVAGYSDSDEYVPGDIVAIPTVLEFQRTFIPSDEDATPDPTGVPDPGTAPDTWTAMGDGILGIEGTRSYNVIPTGLSRQALITSSGVPAWETWPEEPIAFRANITFESTNGVCDMTATAVRYDASNVRYARTYVASTSVDVNAVGPVELDFLCPIPSDGWGNTLPTDRFAIEIEFNNSGGTANRRIDIAVSDPVVETFVIAPAIFANDGSLDYFYCVAAHSDKTPADARYHNDFWYPLPETPEGGAILEIPTPYAGADLAELDFQQSRNVIEVTHKNYPQHELQRQLVEGLVIGRWPMLPTEFKPQADPPVAVTLIDFSEAGDKTIRYQVTFIDDDSGSESIVGSDAATLVLAAPITDASIQSTTVDIVVQSTAHGLENGTPIHIVAVATEDDDRGNENAKIFLETTVQIITSIDANSFSLDNTAGLVTLPVLTDLELEGYPSVTIDYSVAYTELVDVRVPKGTGDRRIEFTWTPPATDVKGRYLVYRRILGDEDWGLLGSTTELNYADEGDTDTDPLGGDIKTRRVANEEDKPPDYTVPFRYLRWPAASGYHAGRQFFAGTLTDPLRVWGSRTGDFRNFNVRRPIQADDAIDFKVDGLRSPQIQRIASLGSLVMLTSGGLVEARGNGNGLITPTDGPNLRSFAYSKAAAALRGISVIDDSLIYIHERQTKLRERRVNLDGGGIGGYQGRDLTTFNRDLFNGHTIEQLAYAETPEPILWVMRSDGTLLGLTYLFEHQVDGWHVHDTGGSDDGFQAVTTVPEEGSDVLYVIAKRTINGTVERYVERLDERRLGYDDVDERVAQFFLDSALTYDGRNPLQNVGAVITFTGGTTWLTGESIIVTGAAEGTIEGFDPSVGNGVRLTDANGLEAEAVFTDVTDPLAIVADLLTDVPVSLQNVPIFTWTWMADDFSGLEHVEAEMVRVVADGENLGLFLVTDGAIPPLSRPYGIVHAGLDYRSEFVTLDADRMESKTSNIGQSKTVERITAFLEDTRGPRFGEDGAPDSLLVGVPVVPEDVVGELLNDARTFELKAGANRHARVRMVQDEPFGVTLFALTTHYKEGGF